MAELHVHLVAVLTEQIRCAQAMLGALTRESDALAGGDAEHLNAAGAEKAQLVETLEALEAERRTLVAAISADTGVNGGAHPEPQWQSLLQLVAECKEQNQRNGALLKARAEHVRSALRLLRGAEPQFYAASGLSPALRSARSLGSA